MAGHRPWKEIRGDADREPERRRRVEAARREVEDEERAFEQTLAELRRARAYTQEQFARLSATSAFGGCEITTSGIGLEVRLKKRGTAA